MNVDLDTIKIDFDFLNSVATNIEYNEQILNFYAVMMNEIDEKLPVLNFLEKGNVKYSAAYTLSKTKTTLFKKLDRMYVCNTKWVMDVYEKQKIKDFQKTNLCKDKFCNNCKRIKQASRMARYIPEIEKYKDYKKVHLVLTAPNVYGLDLKDEIKKYFKSFFNLTRYLSGLKKIKDLDFADWGYVGAIRSLEVTYKGDSYHPHLHVMLLMEKDFEIGKKYNWNSFSKRNGKFVRPFSDKEILIQKIWYLLLNDIKVTKYNIEHIADFHPEEKDQGYSCMMDEFSEGDYQELFKYITKGNGSADGRNKDPDYLMSFDNFKVLYFALANVHQIQGYGKLYHIEDIDVDEDFDKAYDDFIKLLGENEKPRKTMSSPRDLIDDIGEYRLISRKKYLSQLRQVYQDQANETTVNIVDQIEMTVE